jgi:hypothetical protein
MPDDNEVWIMQRRLRPLRIGRGSREWESWELCPYPPHERAESAQDWERRLNAAALERSEPHEYRARRFVDAGDRE